MTQINKFQDGKGVILCNSKTCPNYQLINPHLDLVYSDYNQFHSFATLKVRKSHPHSLKIYKL